MKYGYARVSTDDQNLDLQINALELAGCNEIYSEHVSGAHRERPELTKLFDRVAPGDQVIVWRLDRLGRSVPHLIEIVTKLGEQQVDFQSLNEHIDTTTASGELIFTLMGALAQFERRLIQERTIAGLEAARARGKTLGRPRKLGIARVKHAKELFDQGISKKQVAHLLGVSTATLWRAVRSSE